MKKDQLRIFNDYTSIFPGNFPLDDIDHYLLHAGKRILGYDNILELPYLEQRAFDKSFNTPTLASTLFKRKTDRDFSGQPLPLELLGTILHYSFGQTHQITAVGKQLACSATPSAGAIFPLDIFVMAAAVSRLEQGHYHFLENDCKLGFLGAQENIREYFFQVAINQEFVHNAACILAITADFSRVEYKYNARGYRYILLEAGHLAQNIMLMCAAMGIKNVAIGGFIDDRLLESLTLDRDKDMVCYLLALDGVTYK